jgi:glycosyltransferase involved in cell wall biosynthesis
MKKIRITVGIPTYNRCEVITYALDSVIGKNNGKGNST